MRGKKSPPLTGPQKLVRVLAFVFFGISLANLGRAGVALYYAATLPGLPMTVSWGYLTAAGAFWGVVMLVCTSGMADFYRWGRAAALPAATLYEVWVWVNHLLFDVSDYARQGWTRDAVFTALFLAFTWTLLNLPPIRRVFLEGRVDRK